MQETLYGPWDYAARRDPHPYDDTASYDIAGAWLSGGGATVEDWGGGTGWAKRYMSSVNYVLVDGAWSKWCDKQVDLRHYTTTVDRILMRHVLEHNKDWRDILHNAMESFTDKAALVLFIPPQPKELDVGGPDFPVPDIAISGPVMMDIILKGLGPTGHLEIKEIHYPPENTIQWGWEAVLLMQK